MRDYNILYELWREKATADQDLIAELENVKGDDKEILERFWRDLEFGTGGLRGVIGAGTNRMNVYTVGQATQGLADYLNENFDTPTVAIGHDSRNKSDLFAKEAASVLAGNGIKVYFYKELKPTPMVSFAIREFKCSSGIVITASHNPSKYNGYKCYDKAGYQMTDHDAGLVSDRMRQVDFFEGIKRLDFDEALNKGLIEYIPDEVSEKFYAAVLSQRIEPEILSESDIKILYTPLNGTGNMPVRTVLQRAGVKNLEIVKTQEHPDGNFPTCPYPNPEIAQAFEEAFKLTGDYKADLIIATDPDCDRVGLAVLQNGEYVLLSGNDVCCLLTHYVLTGKKRQGRLPEKAVVIKTIVTSELVRAIGESFGAEVFDLLTGFKYIGELITELEEKGEADRFAIGMEESYGYLCGTHVREKDAVVASLLVADMAAYCKKQGITLYDYLQNLYKEYGYYVNKLLNFAFEGADGMMKMAAMMDTLRKEPPRTIGGQEVAAISDYLRGITVNVKTGEETKISLPSSNVLTFILPNENKVIVRPSGTEPKIKIYISTSADTLEKAQQLADTFGEDMKKILGV
jgi:phosphoglucomutase